MFTSLPATIAVSVQEALSPSRTNDSDVEEPVTPDGPRTSLIFINNDGELQCALGDAPKEVCGELQWHPEQMVMPEAYEARGLCASVGSFTSWLESALQPALVASPVCDVVPESSTGVTCVPVKGATSSSAEVTLVDYGVLEITLPTLAPPVKAYVVAEGVVVDLPEDIPEDVENQTVELATDLAYSQIPPLMSAVETVIATAMPGYPGLMSLPLSPPPLPIGMKRTHIAVPSSTSFFADDSRTPRLILVNSLVNIYLLMYPSDVEDEQLDWAQFGATFDLTCETDQRGTVYQHPQAPETIKMSHDIYLHALRRLIGTSPEPPQAVVHAMMGADSVGEYQYCDVGSGLDGPEEDDSSDFVVNPDMFGG